MNSLKHCKNASYRHLVLALTILIAIALPVSAQKKTSAPAAKPAAAPAKPAAATSAAKPGGATTAAHGPTTAGASHGPTTTNSHPTTTTNHISTNNPTGHNPTATGGAHPAGGPMGHAGTGPGAHPAVASRSMGGHAVPANSHIARAPNGSEIRTRNGRVADVHDARRGMDIHHGLNGSRRVEVERADHSRIVAERGHGYVEHPYRFGGREYGHRTYYYHGRMYDRYYGHYYYHGAYVAYYAPAYYYRPAFYGWVYNPWVAPVSYAWGWAGNPWYGYYGAYFTPYPVYANASLWLTDYMIANTLAAAYQAQAEANAVAQAQAADAVALNEQTKNLIAAEVQRQVALENSEAPVAASAPVDPASSSIQRLLTDGQPHVFLAGSSLDVVNSQGAECAISDGDVLQLVGPPAADATTASLTILSTKGGQECQAGATVSVSFTDLQEMQNHMRETIDQGLSELQAKQGKGGLPAEPVSAQGEPVKAAVSNGAPPPDQNVATELNEQTQAADQAEKEDTSQLSQSTPVGGAEAPPQPIAAPAAAPAQVSLGQTIDQVTVALGAPKSISNLGAKKVYIYPDMKVIFINGKVADVQ